MWWRCVVLHSSTAVLTEKRNPSPLSGPAPGCSLSIHVPFLGLRSADNNAWNYLTIFFVVQDLYLLLKPSSKPSPSGVQLWPCISQPKNKAGNGWWANAG